MNLVSFGPHTFSDLDFMCCNVTVIDRWKFLFVLQLMDNQAILQLYLELCLICLKVSDAVT